MLNRFARALFTRLLTPVARGLLAAGVSPDVVTLIGTLGVCVGALAFYPRGSFFPGTMVITAFVFSDTIDGIMARASGRSGAWGAFLDSTLDRVGDAAVFGGLVLYFAGRGHDTVMAGLALACLVFGQVVSYARARAEGLGMTANVGIAERADRLVAVLVTTGLYGLFLPVIFLEAVLVLLALASLVTIAQRMLAVRRQVLAQHAGTQPQLSPSPAPTSPASTSPASTSPASTSPAPTSPAPTSPAPRPTSGHAADG